MTRLSAIHELRDCVAMSLLEACIEGNRDWIERWGHHMARHDPEELAKTRRLLGRLIEIQVDEQRLATREGEAKWRREQAARAEEAQSEQEQMEPSL